MKNKIAFLLGAGVSDPEHALKIGTKELTDKILNEEEFTWDSFSKCYHNNSSGFIAPEKYEYQKRILKLLGVIKNDFGDHSSFDGHEWNFEDYYNILDSLQQDYNPILKHYRENLSSKQNGLFDPINSQLSKLAPVDLVNEALNYIRNRVIDLLKKDPPNLSQLNFLKRVKNDEDFEKAFIFTLNHDTFIEKYFKVEKIHFGNGFVKHDSTKEIWQPESYDNDFKMNLFKLHGSIDWDEYISTDPYERTIYMTGKKPKNPQILIGSFNKLIGYNSGINFELQCLFWKYLNQCERLIVSGYSFGDLGINSRIINWLYKTNSRRMIIIHPDEKNLLNKAGLEIENNWATWQEQNAVKMIRNRIQETNWDEMKKSLF